MSLSKIDVSQRNRLLYGLLVFLVSGAGLLWRSHALSLPHFAAKYGGDALWALLLFVGFGLVFCRATTKHVALVSLAFAWGIEFSQIYHAPWIDSIRSSRLGHLILGSTFNAPDLVAYLCGIAVGAFLEIAYKVSRRHPVPDKR